MSIKRVVLLFLLAIVLVIAISLVVWFFINPGIQFFIYWVVGIFIAVVMFAAATAQITGYSLRDIIGDVSQRNTNQINPTVLPIQYDLDENPDKNRETMSINNIFTELRQVLMDCGRLDSDKRVRALFADPRLRALRSQVSYSRSRGLSPQLGRA